MLYNIGDDFEVYLEGEELMSMGTVSHMTRSGILATKFRELYSKIVKEYNTYVSNVGTGTIDKFLSEYPIRTILRGYEYDTSILIRIVDHLFKNKRITLYTSLLIKVEVSDKYDNEYKDAINSMMDCCKRHNYEPGEYDEDDIDIGFGPVSDSEYYPPWIIMSLIEHMSIRWNDRLAEFLYTLEYDGKRFTYSYVERDYFYGIKKSLRDVYLKYEPNPMDNLGEYITVADDFPLANVDHDRGELFIHTLEYAVKYGDWIEFSDYMGDKLKSYKIFLVNANEYRELFNVPKYVTINGYSEIEY